MSISRENYTFVEDVDPTQELTVTNVLFNAPSTQWYEYRSGQYGIAYNLPQFINN